MEELTKALAARERAYADAIDRLRALATGETENEVYDLTATLRDAIEVARCARRMLAGRTIREVHQAFGAPGDWGYETAIGAALSDAYQAALRSAEAPK